MVLKKVVPLSALVNSRASKKAKTLIVITDITVNLTAGTKYKASACWLAYSEGTVASKKFTDYDIYVIGPDGSIVADAASINSNVELVSFTAETTGTYTIKLMQYGALKTTKDRIILCHGEAPEALLR